MESVIVKVIEVESKLLLPEPKNEQRIGGWPKDVKFQSYRRLVKRPGVQYGDGS